MGEVVCGLLIHKPSSSPMFDCRTWQFLLVVPEHMFKYNKPSPDPDMVAGILFSC